MRVLRRLGLDRNPLRRASDRIEAGLVFGMVVAFGVLAPLTAVKASQWVTAAGARQVRAEQNDLTDQASPAAAANTIPIPPRLAVYKAAGFLSEQGGDLVPASSAASTTKTHALTMAQVRSRAQLTLVLAPIVVALVMALMFWIIRRVLDRRRLAAWGLAWSVIGPLWSRRR